MNTKVTYSESHDKLSIKIDIKGSGWLKISMTRGGTNLSVKGISKEQAESLPSVMKLTDEYLENEKNGETYGDRFRSLKGMIEVETIESFDTLFYILRKINSRP